MSKIPASRWYLYFAGAASIAGSESDNSLIYAGIGTPYVSISLGRSGAQPVPKRAVQSECHWCRFHGNASVTASLDSQVVLDELHLAQLREHSLCSVILDQPSRVS